MKKPALFGVTYRLMGSEDHVDVDERSAVLRCTVEARSHFPAGKVAARVRWEIDLSSLPEQMTIAERHRVRGTSEQGVGRTTATTWHAIGPPRRLEKGDVVHFYVEIKTGAFAALELARGQGVLPDQVQTDPAMRSASADEALLDARISYVLKKKKPRRTPRLQDVDGPLVVVKD